MATIDDALAALPPWDASQYFQTIVEGTATGSGMGAGLIVGADPNRIALIMSSTNSSSMTVSLKATGGSNQGMVLSNALPPIILLFSETGPLCQQAWYVYNAGFTVMTYYAISLQRWPTDGPPRRRRRRANPA